MHPPQEESLPLRDESSLRQSHQLMKLVPLKASPHQEVLFWLTYEPEHCLGPQGIDEPAKPLSGSGGVPHEVYNRSSQWSTPR